MKLGPRGLRKMVHFLAETASVPHSWMSGLLDGVIGAVVGAIIGVVLGYKLQKRLSTRELESQLIDNLTAELKQLDDKANEYWTIDCRGELKKNLDDRSRARTLEVFIKADIKRLNSSLSIYADRYCPKVQFGPMMGEVQDACTNGHFEGAKRAPDPDRFNLILNATNRVRAQLGSRRG